MSSMICPICPINHSIFLGTFGIHDDDDPGNMYSRHCTHISTLCTTYIS